MSVNGRTVTKKTMVVDGKRTEETWEDGRLTSKVVDGQQTIRPNGEDVEMIEERKEGQDKQAF